MAALGRRAHVSAIAERQPRLVRDLGPRIPEFFAQICAIDLRLEKFPDLSVAQTSLAKLSAIILRADAGGRPVYHVLADSAAALYLLDALTDAAEEFGAGLTVWRRSVTLEVP